MDNRRTRFLIGYIVLAVLLAALFVINLWAGSANVGFGEIWDIIFGRSADSTAAKIILDMRLPRLLAAALLGGCLAVSGFLLQTFFANPIAGPFVLGVSSGAKLAVALVMILCLENGIVLSSGFMVAAAFAGSLVSMGFVLLIAGRVKKMATLIICGIMIGYICSAITEFLVTFAADSNIVNLHNWSMGSFSGIGWDNVKVIAITAAFGLICAFLLAKPMNAYQLGENYARSMGVPIRAFRVALIILSSLLSACVAAFAGPISFVGIAVPQLAKALFNTSKPIHMVPACFMAGASFCLLSDVLARTLFAPTELSVSSVTAVLGAPVVIYVLIKRRKGEA